MPLKFYAICALLLLTVSLQAQQGLSDEEDRKYRLSLCNALLTKPGGAGVTRIDPTLMQIVSFSRSSAGKIARVRGVYASASNAWIDLFFENDLAYAVIYSNNPKAILTPQVAGPGGAMQPYQGNQLNRIRDLQASLANTLQKEPAQEMVLQKQEKRSQTEVVTTNIGSGVKNSVEKPDIPSSQGSRPVYSASGKELHEYRIGGNLYVKYPGNFPQGYNPEWNFVTYNLEAPTFDEFFYDNIGSFKNTNRVRLAERNGKAVFIHSGNYRVADIELPAGKVILSSTPQTFALKNFRSNQTPDAQPTLEDLNNSGAITLSANDEGTIKASFRLEIYSSQKKLMARITSEVFAAPITQNVKQALARQDDAKYNKVLEELIQVHYQGWKLDKLYVPNSMKDSKVSKRDIQGRPSEIFAYYNTSEGRIRSFLVLFFEGSPYAIVESISDNPSIWSLCCIMPYKKVNGQNELYRGEERSKLENLQRQYLLGQWTARFTKTPGEAFQLSSLKFGWKSLATSGQREVEEKEEMSDAKGNPVGQRSITKTKNVTTFKQVPGIQNTGDHDVLIKDYIIDKKEGTITITDDSVWIRQGETVQDFKINTNLNVTSGLNLKTPLNQIGNSK